MSARDVVVCRICGSVLRKVLDLGETPIANNLCETQALALDAPRFPLELVRCSARDCGLYQLSIAVDAATLYGNYTYETPDNVELDEHYDRALDWITDWTGRSHMDEKFIVEIGSNNGSFLKNFAWGRLSHLLGVDPSPVEHTASIPRHFVPFTRDHAEHVVRANRHADLVIARHCLAHIDDVNDVVAGVATLLKMGGLFYIENAYWIDSMLGAQFDQVYHEHMSYLTLGALERLLREHGMRLVDVNFSDVHGGSFMALAARRNSLWQPTINVHVALRAERAWLSQGLEGRFVIETQHEIASTYTAVMAEFSKHHVVAAYGASAKAVTRLGAAKITHEHVRQCIDDSPLKQGKFMPGSGIPIVARDKAWAYAELVPDAVLLTAWNYERSFRERERTYLESGGRFIK